MFDTLLDKFFEKERWETALQKAVEKDMDKSLLRDLADPHTRIEIYRKIKSGQYDIEPPHEALIPKDDGTFRTVYANTGTDRVILSIINDLLFDTCKDMIHPTCKSYQKSIGCGIIVKHASHTIQTMKSDEIGVKVDLSKYFDSVPIQFIDEIFNKIEQKMGKSAIIDMLRRYYHSDVTYNINKNIVHKYTSLKQGCAVAAFLADAVLYDIDKTISNTSKYYVRYSDDILIIDEQWQEKFETLKTMLAEKSLILNPKKVEILHKNKWFKFLGFTIKNDMISLSKSRIKSFQKEICDRTIYSNKSSKAIIHEVNKYLYKGSNQEYSWCTSVLPVINNEKDINTLNSFVMDAIRASITGKTHIGGLGFTDNNDYVILRGHGKNVKSNKAKIQKLDNYYTIVCMKNALSTCKQLYNTIVADM